MDSIRKYYIESIANDAREVVSKKKENVFTQKIDMREKMAKGSLSLTLNDLNIIMETFDCELEDINENGNEIKNEDYPCIVKNGEDTYTIFYDGSNIDIMSLLHELGHAFLHSEQLEQKNTKEHFNGTTVLDLEAQLFARAFIMPRDQFEEVIIQHTVDCKCDIQSIADVYGINCLDVLARGKELNIWE